MRGSSDRMRAAADFTRTGRPGVLRYGASFDRTWLSHRGTNASEDRNLIYTRTSGSTAGGYVDATWSANSRVVLRGGVRADAFSVTDARVLGPRASATWLLSDDASLTLAAGRYHQYVRMPRPLGGGAPPANFADSVRLATHLTVGGATHLALGLNQELRSDLRLGLEGFYKRFDGLPQAFEAPGEMIDHTSGVDVWVRRTGGEVTGWLGYSLAWVWSSEVATGMGSSFAGRQTLSAGASGPVWRGTVLGARFGFGAGLPSAPLGLTERVLRSDVPSFGSGSIDTDAPLSAASPGPYLRLDIHASRSWTTRLGGRSTEVTPYFRILNALDNRDGLFYRYFSGEDGQHGVQAVGTLPVVPVFGVSWRL
jgi:hypothetical protein